MWYDLNNRHRRRRVSFTFLLEMVVETKLKESDEAAILGLLEMDIAFHIWWTWVEKDWSLAYVIGFFFLCSYMPQLDISCIRFNSKKLDNAESMMSRGALTRDRHVTNWVKIKRHIVSHVNGFV